MIRRSRIGTIRSIVPARFLPRQTVASKSAGNSVFCSRPALRQLAIRASHDVVSIPKQRRKMSEELFDVVDEKGNPTGKVGCWHAISVVSGAQVALLLPYQPVISAERCVRRQSLGLTCIATAIGTVLCTSGFWTLNRVVSWSNDVP